MNRFAQRSGFTLMEMILVMLLITVAAGISIPVVDSMLHPNQVAACNDAVRGHLELARNRAMEEGRQICGLDGSREREGEPTMTGVVVRNRRTLLGLVLLLVLDSVSPSITRTTTRRRTIPQGIPTRYSSKVSIRSAKLKSSSVKPPLLCVETASRTLL